MGLNGVGSFVWWDMVSVSLVTRENAWVYIGLMRFDVVLCLVKISLIIESIEFITSIAYHVSIEIFL